MMEKENSFFLHYQKPQKIDFVFRFTDQINNSFQLKFRLLPSTNHTTFLLLDKKKLHKTDLIAPKDRTKTFIALDERLCLNQTKLYFDVAQLAPFFARLSRNFDSFWFSKRLNS